MNNVDRLIFGMVIQNQDFEFWMSRRQDRFERRANTDGFIPSGNQHAHLDWLAQREQIQIVRWWQELCSIFQEHEHRQQGDQQDKNGVEDHELS